MKRDDNVFLHHIVDASDKIIQFTANAVRNDIDTDEKLSLALIRLLEIIGEAANALSEQFRSEHNDIPWQKMIAMRNRLIHGYFDINYDIVWQTIRTDIPRISEMVKPLLP